MSDPIHHLLNVAEVVRRHGDPVTGRWFADSVSRYLASRETLDTCLGLASPGPGQPSPRTRHGKAVRDSFLKQAYELVDGENSTRRCEILASQIIDFEARFWPRWRDLDEPPEGCSKLRGLLFLARQTGEVMPTTGRTVFRAVFGY